MLILTRRSNERIFIGDNIVLSVLSIEGNRVKLGIDAPKEVSILREEIREEGSAPTIGSETDLGEALAANLKAAGNS